MVFSSNTNLNENCCVFNFHGCSVDGKHLMRFQSETSVIKFFRLSVDSGLYFVHDSMELRITHDQTRGVGICELLI